MAGSLLVTKLERLWLPGERGRYVMPQVHIARHFSSLGCVVGWQLLVLVDCVDLSQSWSLLARLRG